MASASSRQGVAPATEHAIATWDREPLFHVSSPLVGWGGPRPERHHDFIDVRDFPECWRALDVTVEVEAKAKEAEITERYRRMADLADEVQLKPRKADVRVTHFGLAWAPFWR